MNTLLRYAHAVAVIGLAIFFINAGMKNFRGRPLRPVDERQLIETVIIKQTYEPPAAYNVTMNTLRQNGFLKLIGIFQITAGLLMFIPALRLTGLLLLLPIILNIFLLHVFIDNRAHENVETGILLAVTLLLTGFYHRQLRLALWLPAIKRYRL